MTKLKFQRLKMNVLKSRRNIKIWKITFKLHKRTMITWNKSMILNLKKIHVLKWKQLKSQMLHKKLKRKWKWKSKNYHRQIAPYQKSEAKSRKRNYICTRQIINSTRRRKIPGHKKVNLTSPKKSMTNFQPKIRNSVKNKRKQNVKLVRWNN